MGPEGPSSISPLLVETVEKYPVIPLLFVLVGERSSCPHLGSELCGEVFPHHAPHVPEFYFLHLTPPKDGARRPRLVSNRTPHSAVYGALRILR